MNTTDNEVADRQPGPGFALGRTYITPGALAALEAAGEPPAEFLQRHVQGDWGELDEEDSALNEAGVGSGEDRIFSAYRTGLGRCIWCITEWDRSATTLLLPAEY